MKLVGTVIIHLLCLTQVHSFIVNNGQQPECWGIACHHGGHINYTTCTCVCPSGFDGFFCETELKETAWPKGHYSLLSSVFGCPEDSSHGWHTGYVNMTLADNKPEQRWKMPKPPDTPVFPVDPHIRGPYSRRALQLNFCTRRDSDVHDVMTENEIAWPTGDYCVFQFGSACPFGFESSSIQFGEYQLTWSNTDGILPHIVIENETTAVPTFYFCCHTSEHEQDETSVVFPNSYPFIMIMPNSSVCAEVAGMSVSEERFDLVDDLHKFESAGNMTVLSDTGDGYQRLHMCFYASEARRECVFEMDGGFSYRGRQNTSIHGNPCLHWYEASGNSIVYNERFDPYRDYVGDFDHNYCRTYWPWGQYNTHPWCPVKDHNGDVIVEPCNIPLCDVDPDLEAVDINKPVYSVDHRPGKEPENAVDGIFAQQFVSERPKHKPWLQIDLEENLEVHAIYIQREYVWFPNNLRRPGLYVSPHRWDFLTHGALQCTEKNFPRRARQFWYQCYRPIVGQYVTIRNFDDPDPDTRWGDYHFLEIKEITVYYKRNACSRRLGLVSGDIRDFQIDGSGDEANFLFADARIFNRGSGWCFEYNVTKYLQVDTIVPTVIDGFEIQHTPNGRYENVEEVEIEFGMTLDSLSRYEDGNNQPMKFRINTDGKPDMVNRFMFLKPFVARYVRVIVTSPEFTAVCMKMELIGCPKRIVRDTSCSSPAAVHVGYEVTTRTAFWMESDDYHVNITEAECMALCDRTDKCLSIYYNNKECSLFTSTRYNPHYQHWVVRDMDYFMELYTRLCIEDIRDFDDCSQVITEPVVIESPFYPQYFGQLSKCVWTIDFPPGTYPRLQFLHLEFPEGDDVAKLQANGYFDVKTGVCKDSLSLGEFVITVDNAVDYRNSLFISHTPNMTLTLKTCARYSKASLSWFKINITYSDVPGCGFLSSGHDVSCGHYHAYIAVPGYPTSIPENMEHFWTIEGLRGQYVELTVQVLFFPRSMSRCRDIFIAVEDRSLSDEWMQIGKYCDYQQVLEPITSSWEAMRVTFKSGTDDNALVGSGFMAEYRLLQYVQDIVLTTNPDCPQGWIYHMDSCYQLFTVQGGITWISAEDHCNSMSGHLVSLTSQTEVSFIHYMLTERWTVWTNNADFYIGLKKTDYGGNFADYRWSDGSPATFLAWYKGSTSGESQPNGMNNELCTFLRLFSILSTDNWHDVACAYDNIDNYICEIHVGTDNAGKTTIAPSMLTTNYTTIPGLFTCNGGELTKSIFVCDGVMDCFGGADEENCHTEKVCKDYKFECSMDECIDTNMLCNFVKDCSNGADEVGCVYPPCKYDEWRCTSGQCIPIDFRCDVKIDCLDGTDEEECSLCQGGAFQCYDQRCVTSQRLCDTFYDCTGRFHEDEVDRNCTFKTRATCSDWYALGKRSNGTYLINLNQPASFEVECRFGGGTDGELTIETLIHHDMETTVTLKDRGESKTELRYGATDQQIRLVKQISTCRQYLRIGCGRTTFYLRWIAFDGTFFETRNQTDTCHCPYVEKCNTTIKKCNCFTIEHGDWFNEDYFEIRYDEGMLRNQSAIPVKWFATPSLESQFREEAQLTVGPLICTEDKIDSTVQELMVCKNGHITHMSNRCIMDMDLYGDIVGCRDLSHLENCDQFECPPDHIKCHHSYCIPTRFVCDGTHHCPRGEDELSVLCGETTYCEGLYRCRDSRICIPHYQICDGIPDCPLRDDESPCTAGCPKQCNCTGFSITCTVDGFIHSHGHPNFYSKIKSLHIKHGELQLHPGSLSKFPLINTLNMAKCGVKILHSFQFNHTKNLVLIDVRYNRIQELQKYTFYELTKLRSLYLRGNRLKHIHPMAFATLGSLKKLDISGFSFKVFEYGTFDGLRSIDKLNISYNDLKAVKVNQFRKLSTLRELDMRGNQIHDFGKNIFYGLDRLEFLYADVFTLCCVKPPQVLEENCYPAKNEFSSCEDLMRNDILRVAIWLIGIAAFVGNIVVLVIRFYVERDSLGKTYSIFVTNLSIADFLMGVYLIIIAITDSVFRGSYVWNDFSWRTGNWCKMAGVITTVASEGSVLFLCLITLDRLLVVKFPFGNVRISKVVSLILCCFVWVSVLLLAVIPLVINPKFYSRSAVCLALPLTRDRPKGWEYSIGIYIVFNFLAFVLIATAQIVIYLEISNTRMKVASRGRRMDMAIARKLFFVAITDFMCWFPVGLMGILALNDHVISGQVYAWIAVFVLPINSAINPFLYTLGSSISRQRMTTRGRSFSKTSSIQEQKTVNVTEVFDSELFLFGQPKPVSKQKIPLDQYLGQHKLNHKEAFIVALKLCRALELLHTTEMVHGAINTSAVVVTTSSNGRIRDVALKSSPKFCTEEENFKKDVYEYGEVLKLILRNLCGTK